VLKKRGRTPARTVPKVVAKGLVFPWACSRSGPQDRPGTHFPNLKVVPSLKRMAFEKKYLLPAGYSFVISKVDAIINKPPLNCIAIYRVAFNYDVRFPLHPVIVEILRKFKRAPAQIVPTSRHKICFFIATCELRDLTCITRTFDLVYNIQIATKETGDLMWYCFNNKPGYVMAIEKKSKVKHCKYNFLFIRRDLGWENLPGWNEEKLVRNPFGEPSDEEQKTARYFLYYI